MCSSDLNGVFKSVFPISDFNNTASLEFVSYTLEPSKYDVDECRQRGMTFAAPIKVTLRLIVFDVNEETEAIAQKAFQDAGLQYCIHPITGNAIEIIPRIDGPFDLVFIDADKKNYAAYYDLVFDKVRAGGLIIADNVLWSGKILQPEDKMDTDTLAIHSFNRKVQNDIRVECLILPIRDGLMLVKKK